MPRQPWYVWAYGRMGVWACGRKTPPSSHTPTRPHLYFSHTLFAALLLCYAAAPAQGLAQTRHALLIGGLGGSAEHTDRFQQYLFETRRALVDHLGFSPEHVVVLAEEKVSAQPFASGISTAENVRAAFARLAGTLTEDDHLYVLLYGHGSYDGERAHLNIPRRDLSDADYADLLSGIRAGRIVFINTASASASFAEALSGPGRIVITATRTPTQRNETNFPQFLAEALTDPAADLDKDGSLSVREVFSYASAQTAQSYEASGHLATEHALLEDTGDGQGHRAEELEQAAEGNLAAITYLGRGRAALAAGGNASPEQLREKQQIEEAIAEVKSRKPQMREDAYYAELETLFVRLARLNDRIETP